MINSFVHFILYEFICSIDNKIAVSIPKKNEYIPEENSGHYAYPLYYEGTNRINYDMACFVLGRSKAITLQELYVHFEEEGDHKIDHDNCKIGESPLGSIWYVRTMLIVVKCPFINDITIPLCLNSDNNIAEFDNMEGQDQLDEGYSNHEFHDSPIKLPWLV